MEKKNIFRPSHKVIRAVSVGLLKQLSWGKVRFTNILLLDVMMPRVI